MINKALDDVLLTGIAKNFGTPCWVYDAEPIKRRVKQLKIFDVVRYAQKANPSLHILKMLKGMGVCVDAVSLGELERAHKVGFTGDGDTPGIVYTSDVLEDASLKRIIELDVPVNVGSPQMLEQIGREKPGHRIWLRINPGFGHGHSKKTNTGGVNSKHGNWHENLQECYDLIAKYRLELVGLHMHIGSGVDYAHLHKVCATMVEHVKKCPFKIKAISAGGGLPVVYKENDAEIDIEQYFAIWDTARKQIESHLGYSVVLELEPGRIVVAESGYLIAEVRAFKNVGPNHFVLVNAGFNELMRPAMYGSFHRIGVISKNSRPLLDFRPTVVAGPLCEAGDVFTQNSDGDVVYQDLPKVEVGDLLVFHNAGAYGVSMSSNYNSRPLAPEVFIDNNDVKLIRRRQTFDELFQLEAF